MEKAADPILVEFEQQIERRRLQWLRTRFLWYAGLVIVISGVDMGLLLLAGLERSVTEAGSGAGGGAAGGNAGGLAGMDMTPVWILVLRMALFGGAMVLVVRSALEPRQVIRLTSWLIVLAVISSLVGEDYSIEPRTGLGPFRRAAFA